jgi:hypothetical protein
VGSVGTKFKLVLPEVGVQTDSDRKRVGLQRLMKFAAEVGAIREHVEREEERRGQERDDAHRKFREEERLKQRQRFLSGADVGWTKIDSSDPLYCRRNGRAFRIETGKDKRWKLYRIGNQEDEGELLGVYPH